MPFLFFYFIIFVLGLIVGSFLNCVIYRSEAGLSFVGGRSFCPKCNHRLSWQDLFPVLSYILLGGKCHYCKKSISLQYPLVELATAIIFVLILQHGLGIAGHDFLNLKFFLDLLFSAVVSSFLIIIFVSDLKSYVIPDEVVYPAIAITFCYQLLFAFIFNEGNFQQFLNFLLAAVVSSAFFMFIVLISRGNWMGIGDIKLAFLMGLFLGWPEVLVALFLAFFIGAIVGLGLIFAHKKKFRSEVPFGPFLVTGTFLALFWGQEITSWYLNFFNIY